MQCVFLQYARWVQDSGGWVSAEEKNRKPILLSILEKSGTENYDDPLNKILKLMHMHAYGINITKQEMEIW